MAGYVRVVWGGEAGRWQETEVAGCWQGEGNLLLRAAISPHRSTQHVAIASRPPPLPTRVNL